MGIGCAAQPPPSTSQPPFLLLPFYEAVYAARHEYCQFTWWRNVRFSPNLAALHSSFPPRATYLVLPMSSSSLLPFHLFLSLSLSLLLSPSRRSQIPGLPPSPPLSLSLSPFSRFVPLSLSFSSRRVARDSLFHPLSREAREKRGGRQEKARGGQQKRRRRSEGTLDAILENGVDVCARRVTRWKESERGGGGGGEGRRWRVAVLSQRVLPLLSLPLSPSLSLSVSVRLSAFATQRVAALSPSTAEGVVGGGEK